MKSGTIRVASNPILYFLLSLGMSCAGKGQYHGDSNSKTDSMNIPKVTSAFETFPFQSFDSVSGFTSTTLQDGTYIEYQEQGEDGYIERISPKDSYFCIIKKYYKNGGIKEKGLSVNYGGFKKGVWYYFDETGKPVSEENHDAGFTFTFEKLIAFLEREKIPLVLGYDGDSYYHTSIYNLADTGKTVWVVEWMNTASAIPNTVERMLIDGTTGEVLEKQTRHLKKG